MTLHLLKSLLVRDSRHKQRMICGGIFKWQRREKDAVKVQKEWLFLSIRYQGRLPGWSDDSTHLAEQMEFWVLIFQ